MEEIAGVKALSYYLERLRKFVKSKKNILVLPNISTELRDIFLKIVQEGVGFLQGDELSAIIKLEGNKLGATIESYKNFKLTHEFKDGPHGTNVLMYRKVEVNTFKMPEPLRQPSEVQTATCKAPPSPLVTPIFKIRCLNCTTQFVKDDSQLVMKYPPMASAQAEFVITMISQGIDGNEQTDIGYGYRSMYAPLWEAMRLFGLKYRYTLRCDDGLDNLKRVVFEKQPKSKPVEPEKTEEVIQVSHDTPDTARSISPAPNRASTSIPNTALEKSKKGKTKQKTPKVPKFILNVKSYIDQGKLTEQFIKESLKRISEFLFADEEASIIFSKMEFCQYYFLRYVETLSKLNNAYMFFNSESQKLLGDIKHNTVNRGVLYKVQEMKAIKKSALKDIQFMKQPKFTDKPVTAKENEKAATKAPSQSQDQNISPNSTIDTTKKPQLTKKEQETFTQYRRIINLVAETSGKSYIVNTLQEILNFLAQNESKKSITFKKSTAAEKNFLKYLNTWSRMEEMYAVFDEKCRELLLGIKVNAQKYELKYNAAELCGGKGQEIFADVTITKKLKEQERKILKPKEKEKRGRSLSADRRAKTLAKGGIDERSRECSTQQKTAKEKSATAHTVQSDKSTKSKTSEVGTNQRPREPSTQRKSIKEKLMEGLAQPVQSDKAMKMMQSMGWKGGALGLRGNGITEPIMPALDTQKRAGLGLERTKPKPKDPKPLGPKPKETKPLGPKPKETKPLGPKPKETKPLGPKPKETKPLGPKPLETKPLGPKPIETPAKLGPTSDLLPNGIFPPFAIPPHLLPPGIVNPETHKRESRSSHNVILATPSHFTAFIDNSFAVMAVRLWNKLPEHLRKAQSTPTDTFWTIFLSQDYRVFVLDSLLNFITSNENTVKFIFTSAPGLKKPKKKMRNFITIVCDMLCKRKNWGLSLKAETMLLGKLLFEMRSRPHLMIGDEMIDLTSCLVHKFVNNNTIQNHKGIKEPRIIAYIDLTGDDCVEIKEINTGNTDVSESKDIKTIDSSNVGKIRVKSLDVLMSIDTLNEKDINPTASKTQVTVESNKSLTEILENNNNVMDQTSQNVNNYENDATITQINEDVLMNVEYSEIITLSANNNSNNVADSDDNIENADNQNINNFDNDKTTNVATSDSSIEDAGNQMDNNYNNDKTTNVAASDSFIEIANNEINNNYYDNNKITNGVESDSSIDDAGIQININDKPADCSIADSSTTITYDDQDINIENVKSEPNLPDDDDIFTDDFDCNVIDIDSEDEDRLLNPELNYQFADEAIKIEPNLSEGFNELVNSLENVALNDSFDAESQKDESDSGISQNSNGKRRSLDTPREEKPTKKCKRSLNNLCIVHKDYPEMKINKKKASEIQQSILMNIDYTREMLPMLTCEGIQNGGLVYSCHDEKSFLFVENLIKSLDDFRILYDFECKTPTRKMAFRLNNYIDEEVNNILNRIDLYNIGVNASTWKVIKKEEYIDFVVVGVELDERAYNYICDCNFILCAGNDCAKFTIIWD